ncbi:hypothetical protein CQA49_06905 [Helicobacter sp. MIT 00-7814]|uniref:hypothetical protein n=1 Tax=unclassified Helicobacter TaxID=2593540 RepID=UPI000E1F8055|nr:MULTISPECIES: hypothetical protein [unclassified Helicobacter]RDU53371.1 hypothetical protein CQA49_06905 [Helicobacter sp. MIT 00-7814]RDU54192.1 hypothetical protein CQA37_06145 [Helicobacter sp. MIT 99-10781]
MYLVQRYKELRGQIKDFMWIDDLYTDDLKCAFLTAKALEEDDYITRILEEKEDIGWCEKYVTNVFSDTSIQEIALSC